MPTTFIQFGYSCEQLWKRTVSKSLKKLFLEASKSRTKASLSSITVNSQSNKQSSTALSSNVKQTNNLSAIKKCESFENSLSFRRTVYIWCALVHVEHYPRNVYLLNFSRIVKSGTKGHRLNWHWFDFWVRVHPICLRHKFVRVLQARRSVRETFSPRLVLYLLSGLINGVPNHP